MINSFTNLFIPVRIRTPSCECPGYWIPQGHTLSNFAKSKLPESEHRVEGLQHGTPGRDVGSLVILQVVDAVLVGDGRTANFRHCARRQQASGKQNGQQGKNFHDWSSDGGWSPGREAPFYLKFRRRPAQHRSREFGRQCHYCKGHSLRALYSFTG